ncbi:MAG TPA: putative glycoside hydrolase, partial [Pseudoxanthomonas sp.]|nr:putative glycoside hydrolase [Pseudoxanthomonas sp.]
AVFLSGRPLWVNREINASDAFVAAWLPGSEGGGVADVLLRDAKGKVAHDFRGKLPFSWPRTAVQTPLNVGQANYDPQFAYGYGLTYADKGDLAALAEDPGADLTANQSHRFFERGALGNGWRLRTMAADSSTSELTKPIESKNVGVSVGAVDHKAQEDAWRFKWTGSGTSSIALVPSEALDLARETNGDVMLLLTLRLESAIAKDTALFVECGDACRAKVPVGQQLAALPSNTWTRIGIPLKCFQAANASMGKLTLIPGVEAAAGTQFSVSEVGYGTVADQVLKCGP